MPWSETTAMDQKVLFALDVACGRFSLSELCERFGISRKTGHKWAQRFREEGVAGLMDRSHATRTSPHRTPLGVEQALLGMRARHPRWGARKIAVKVAQRHPELDLPHVSTIHEILRRNGLVREQPKRRSIGHPGRPTGAVVSPNDCWSADFKGQFRLGNGSVCYPLTVTDNYSRYLLGCQGLPGTQLEATKAVFTKLFKEFGLPRRIRTDNGVPFAAPTLGRLSQLSVWWLKLGIHPELIEPGKPQQNGRHERMHRTLKEATAQPPQRTMRSQQQCMDQFRVEYNQERPHEALAMAVPKDWYQASPRPMPTRVESPVYPDRFEVRYVSANGGIRWKNRWVNLTSVLVGEHVGLEEVEDGLWEVYFGTHRLGRLHERYMRIEDHLCRLKRKVSPISPD